MVNRNKSVITVHKLPPKRSPSHVQEFNKQFINYLEVIENKDKIKQDVVNKDFDPENDLKGLDKDKLSYPNPEFSEDFVHMTPIQNTYEERMDEKIEEKIKGNETGDEMSSEKDYAQRQEERLSKLKMDSDDEISNNSEDEVDIFKEDYNGKKIDSDSDDNYNFFRDQTDSYKENDYKQNDYKTDDDQDDIKSVSDYKQNDYKTDDDQDDMKSVSEYKFGEDESVKSDDEFVNSDDEFVKSDDEFVKPEDTVELRRDDRRFEKEKEFQKEKEFEKEIEKEEEFVEERTGNMRSRLEELLGNSDDEDYKTPVKKSRGFVPRSQQKLRSIRNKNIPTLADLEEDGLYRAKKTMVDVDKLEQSHDYNRDDKDEEDEKKRELLFKFDLLRKSYKSSDIPDYSIHTDLKTIKIGYESTMKRLSLESNVDNYKTYLIGGFMLCEFVMGKFLKFDMEGFSQQQIASMSSYERLLLELGEKNYVPQDKKWPVEFRLMGLIIMNAGFFVVSKMLMKKTGSNLLGMINGMNKGASSNKPKRKMRAPTVDLDDLP